MAGALGSLFFILFFLYFYLAIAGIVPGKKEFLKGTAAALALVEGKPSLALYALSKEADKPVEPQFSLDPFGYFSKVHFCDKLVIKGKEAVCINRKVVVFTPSVSVSVPIEIENPVQLVSFVPPAYGYVCYYTSFTSDCIKRRFGKEYLRAYFWHKIKEKEYPNKKLSEKEKKEIDALAACKVREFYSILDEFNQALKEKRIKVSYKQQHDSVLFTIKVPSELIEKYVNLLGTPAVLGIKVSIPTLEAREFYYDITI